MDWRSHKRWMETWEKDTLTHWRKTHGYIGKRHVETFEGDTKRPLKKTREHIGRRHMETLEGDTKRPLKKTRGTLEADTWRHWKEKRKDL